MRISKRTLVFGGGLVLLLAIVAVILAVTLTRSSSPKNEPLRLEQPIPPPPQPADALDSIAQKLDENRCMLIGSLDCGWTKRQLDEFGDAKSKIRFVDCNEPNNAQTCQKVKAMPTWTCLVNGTTVEGYYPPSELPDKLQLASIHHDNL